MIFLTRTAAEKQTYECYQRFRKTFDEYKSRLNKREDICNFDKITKKDINDWLLLSTNCTLKAFVGSWLEERTNVQY